MHSKQTNSHLIDTLPATVLVTLGLTGNYLPLSEKTLTVPVNCWGVKKKKKKKQSGLLGNLLSSWRVFN